MCEQKGIAYKVSCVVYSGQYWGVKSEWLGWRRLILLGFCVNVVAPALTLWFAGWQLWIGRIPRTPATDILAIERWDDDQAAEAEGEK